MKLSDRIELSRSFLARQVNRGQRGKYWTGTAQMPLLAYISLRQMEYFSQFPDIVLIPTLMLGGLFGMWFLGWADEHYGVWAQQMEHRSGQVNPIQKDVYRHIIDIKEELGLDVTADDISEYHQSHLEDDR